MRARAAYIAAVLALAVTGAGLANAPDRSPRPDPRPGADLSETSDPEGLTRVIITASAFAPRASLRPALRPGGTPSPRTAAVTSAPPPTSTPSPQVDLSGLFAGTPNAPAGIRASTALAVARSLRPALRPDGLEARVRATATRQTPARVAQPGTRGGLCGSPGLVGDRLQSITGRISGCGIAEPIRLREVDGIALTTPATINCNTARSLQTWVQRSLVPEVGRRGGGVANLRVVASYACRTRNSQAGARLSEHARGNAIDIAGIGLVNGTELTVLTDWRNGREGRILQSVHRGACGPFGTVLGPNSDRFHQDHFHFDVASYRSGPYCR